jgi:hypothetical protein
VRLRTYAGNCRRHHASNNDKLPASVQRPYAGASGNEAGPQGEENELKTGRHAELRVKR